MTFRVELDDHRIATLTQDEFELALSYAAPGKFIDLLTWIAEMKTAPNESAVLQAAKGILQAVKGK